MKTKIILVILILSLATFLTSAKQLNSEIITNDSTAQFEDSLIPGRIKGTGTYFEIRDSEYFNISLKSTEKIEVILESIPRMISLDIKSTDNNIDSTVLTISGLEPNKTYYKYEDSYKNEAVFVSDENGAYSWTQDISQLHHIWLQEIKSTIFLPEDCSAYGTWYEDTRTCVLNQDLNDSVGTGESNITLDCDGHSMSGSDTGYGINVYEKDNITIKNCVVSRFSYGIYLSHSDGIKLINNTVSKNGFGIFIHNSNANTLINNTVNLNQYIGVWFISTANSTISGSNISNNSLGGLIFDTSGNNMITDNVLSNNDCGIGFIYPTSAINTVINNNILNNSRGICFNLSNNNKIYHNNFIDNGSSALAFESIGNDFDNGYPGGGNYWDDYNGVDLYNGPAQNQLGSDGIGDSPYAFNNGQDNYPFMVESGWELPVCGNSICEEGETFENCYQDCAEQGIEKYFPYWKFSKGETYHPTSFYFDNDADVENNRENYEAQASDWVDPYVYAHTVEDENYFTIQYWMYMVYSDWRGWLNDHEHDFDATIFVVFDKNNLDQPIEVRFARHIYIGAYSWNEIEKINTTHPVAYVAKGSHGGYCSEDMGSLDIFNPGGLIYSHNVFNSYRAGYCSEIIKKEINGEQKEFCKVKNKLLKGKAQNEPADGYWPKLFTGKIYSLFEKSPWHPDQDRWFQTRPEGLTSALEFGVDCPVDLHIYDPHGRHIGINYQTNEPEIEIPDAIFKQEGEKEYIMIPNPLKGDYRVKIVGTDDGEYDFTMIASEDMKLIEKQEKENIPIAKDEVQTFTVVGLWETPKEIKEKTIIDLESIENSNIIIQRNIQKAINLINKSLNQNLWIDDTHLDSKQGGRVFNYELRAALRLKLLERLINNNQSLDIVKNVNKKLTKADYVLAETILNEAKEMEIESNQFKKRIKRLLAKAEKELIKAKLNSENNKPVKSIIHSKKSWHYSQAAIKLANYNN